VVNYGRACVSGSPGRPTAAAKTPLAESFRLHYLPQIVDRVPTTDRVYA
jgi:hypothetical protein